MDTRTPPDELLSQAFELAYFILGDRTIAIYVAMEALNKLHIVSSAQDRRLDYTPIGRLSQPAIRTKINLSEIHLLQRLIYVETEPFERLLEGQQRSSQEDLIIRFIKHLVRITIKHNSFYLSLGLCRLLYNYTTTETAEVYNFIIQNPDRAKDDYYYRSRKKHLLEEMKQRFGDAVKIVRARRGEERFQAQEDSARQVDLIEEALRRFTPWQSSCVLSCEFDSRMHVIAPLLFEGKNPNEEHEVELNRIHTLLHPDCFQKVTDNIGLGSPQERLAIPQFFLSGDDQNVSGDRFNPAALEEGEVDAVRRYLKRHEARRKSPNTLVSIQVDGEEWASFDAASLSEMQFDLEAGAEFIEVKSGNLGEDTLLTVYPLTYDEVRILPSGFSTVLDRGRRLNFRIQSREPYDKESANATVSVSLSEGQAVRFTSWLRHQFPWRKANLLGLRRWASLPILRAGLALIILTMAVASLRIYWRSGEPSQDHTLVAQEKPPAEQVLPPPAPPPADNKPTTEDKPGQKGGEPHAKNSSASNIGSDRGPTRRAEWVADPTQLLAVRRVYVDPLGTGPVSERVRRMLIADLQSTSRFLVVDRRDDADAVFKGVVTKWGENAENTALALRLVNAEGKVVWPLARQGMRRRFKGTEEKISSFALRALLTDVGRLENLR